MKIPLRITIGILILLTGANLYATIVYVSQSSASPTPPYASWSTASKNIQDAIDAAGAADTVLVSNGVYNGGLSVSKPLTLVSANGPLFTTINGGGTNRCISISSRTWMRGFTMTNGWAAYDGGAVWATYATAFLTNCIISANCASNGGGVYEATLYNCILAGNCASNGAGGAAFISDLYNCTLTGNSALRGGGAFYSTLYNCIVYYNSATNGPNYAQIWGMTNCCTTPDPGTGSGNITGAPMFVDYAGGNLRLQSTSPCVNSGNNQFALLEETDLDGNPRISAGVVDMGAYEYQAPGPPFISVQPFTQTMYSGTDVSLQAGAYGSVPLSWQWWFNDTAIPNASNSSLSLPAITTNQAGNYFVVVSNTLGAATSQVAILTVLAAAPAVTLLQPTNQTVQVGSNVTLMVSATGSLPLSWQWSFNGTALPAATNSSLSLPSVTTNQTGTYSVVVTNPIGSVTSVVAVLTVFAPPPGFPPSITIQPASQTVSVGSTVTLAAEATGSMPMFWQWLFNKTPISGGNSSNLTLNAVTMDQVGIYSVVVTNAFGTTTSADATLSVHQSATAYVWQNSPRPRPPYTNWDTAAHTIQDAVNASSTGDTVLVTNGAYSSITVTNPLTLVSVSGPQFTIIDGGAATPCVQLTSDSTLSGFTITNGIGTYGAGVVGSYSGANFLTNCVLTGNHAYLAGGGAVWCTLYNCTLTGNWGETNGEAAANSTLYNCTLSGNTGDTNYSTGAAVYGGTLYNCTVTSNSLAGADTCTLNNCTLTSNQRGGAWYSMLYNSIAYYNQPAPWAPLNSNYISSGLNYCCTMPMPGQGVGNITNEPLFVDPANGDFHLQLSSPCINSGNNSFVSVATDLDGNPRIVGGTVDIGAYESAYQPPPPITATRYVWQQSPSPIPPYTNWDTAAHTIQDAVDVGATGDTVLVTNGFYATGGQVVKGTTTNRVVLDKPLTLQSVNGPAATVIAGRPGTNGGLSDGAIRCVYIATNAILSGFTLTNGYTTRNGTDISDIFGGGTYCEPAAIVTNCILSGNSSAEGGGTYGGTFNNCFLTLNSGAPDSYGGGGAYQATLNNCLVMSNSASGGGGATESMLNNCTVVGNSGLLGGGVLTCSVSNSIVYYNTPVNVYGSTLIYSCTAPMPPAGAGNFTNEPLFVSLLGGDFHLQSSSPCINSGNNAAVFGPTELDGNSRIVGGTVDMGAYEFQEPLSLISQAWLQQYGLATDGSADLLDPDGDGMNNWQEWVTGTVPTNALSCLRVMSVTPTRTNVTVSWQSSLGTTYFLQRGVGLFSPYMVLGTNMVVVATNIFGSNSITTYVDTNTTATGPSFYRVGVRGP